MPILTYGINHKSAPLEIREKIAYNPMRAAETLRELLHKKSVNEAVLISTCNRVEIYTTPQYQEIIKDWLISQHRQENLDISTFCYSYQGIEAIQHLLRVASGLDSMVVGEPQILGQVKESYRIACESGTVGKQLQYLFPSIFSISKQIRHQTNIGKNPVSMAYAIIHLAKKIFSKLERCNVLLVGAGQIMEMIITYLGTCGIKNITIANRSLEKALSLAKECQGRAINFSEIPVYLKEADIVITATASSLPIIGKGMVESAIKYKKRRPLFMVDLAVPRDIEPEVGNLEDIYLFNIDDLKNVIANNLKDRDEAAQQAENLIKMQAEHYMRKLHILEAKDIIQNYRFQLEALHDQELKKALEKIQQGGDPQVVVKYLARNLINKVMHKPTVKLRKAAYQEQVGILLLAKELFEEG